MKNIILDGQTYSGISEVSLPISGGTALFKDKDEIVEPSGSVSITSNGTYDVTTKASAVVNVPAPEINLQNKTATANGEVTADEGYDGLGVVTVAVSGDTPTYQEKTATQNGVVLPDEGYDALSKVTVNVPTPTPTLITKSISANGTYPASADNADGFSSVTVNVPAPVLPTLTNPASASDILSGKEAIDGDGAKLTGTCTFDADTSDADAVASDIAQGKTAYVNGAKVVGTASGGELPTALNVLDAGVLSLTEDTDGVRIDFNKTLETTPKGICVWCSNIGHKDYQVASGSDTLFALYAVKTGVYNNWVGAQNYVLTGGNITGGSVLDGISIFTTSYITFKASKYKPLKKQIYNASNELVDAVWNWIVFG